MIKIVILDFDDTLIDNQYLDYQSFKQSSLKNRLNVITKNDLKKMRQNSFNAKQIISKTYSHSEANLNNYLLLRKEFLQSIDSLPYLKLRPNSKNFLKFLNQNKIKIIICTLRKNKKIIKNFLKEKKLVNLFSSIIYLNENDSQITSKKNPKKIKEYLVKQIILKNNKKNYEYLLIGDSVEDEYSAIKNNISYFIMRFENDIFNKPKLRNQKESFIEIKKFIKSQNKIISVSKKS